MTIWLEITLLSVFSGVMGALLHRYFFRQDTKRPLLHRDYFTGLNYLINEEPDKAVDVFVNLLEVDPDTVETHLALGALFRRRGEVSRAIRVHRNVIARPHLDGAYREKGLLALAKDYLSAGLLDRAEGVLNQLRSDVSPSRDCLEDLLIVYQKQKDWPQAIEIAILLHHQGHASASLVSHLYCEYASNDLDCDLSEAKRLLKLAEKYEINDRTAILKSRVYMHMAQYRKAQKTLAAAGMRSPHLLPEIVNEIRRCYAEQPAYTAVFLEYLLDCTHAWAHAEQLVALASYVKKRQGAAMAIDFLVHGIEHASEGVVSCIRWLGAHQLLLGADGAFVWEQLHHATRHLAQQWPIYHCQECGLSAGRYHWSCPGCLRWGTYVA